MGKLFFGTDVTNSVPFVLDGSRELTLLAGSWSNNTQSITLSGTTATDTIYVCFDSQSVLEASTSGIVLTGCSTNTITFSCVTQPTNDILVKIIKG